MKQNVTSILALILMTVSGLGAEESSSTELENSRLKKEVTQLKNQIETLKESIRREADHTPSPPFGAFHKRLLEKFDLDGDGRISPEERKLAVPERGMGERFPRGFGNRDKPPHESDAERGFPKKGGHHMKDAMQRMRSKFLSRNDLDEDGVLSDEEREKARVEMQKHWQNTHKEMLNLYDADKDGELSCEEKHIAAEAKRKKILAEFDADGSGDLNKEEKKVAFESMLESNPSDILFLLKHKLSNKAGEKGFEKRGEGFKHPKKE